MSLINNIQALCSRENTTLVGLEREIGLGRGTIRNWDKSSPSIDKLQKVADYFKVSTDRLTMGFEWKLFTQLIGYIQNGRTHEQFAEDTGVDLNELSSLCMGTTLERPSLETLEKILSSNPVDFIVDREELLKAAGYDLDKHKLTAYVYEAPKNTAYNGSMQPDGLITSGDKQYGVEFKSSKPLSLKEERGIAHDLEKILSDMESDNALAFCGESPEDEEERELLKASLLYSMRLAKQMAKKKFTPKKYRKED